MAHGSPETDDPTDEPHHDDEEQVRRFWREVPILLIGAIAIAILLKTFLIQAFFIPSISMEPTLDKGDRVLVCRVCTRFGGVDRGDVIVFSDPQPTPAPARGPVGGALHWLGEAIGVAQPQNDDFIKRVIGLPGDVVELHDGNLFVNGEQVQESYLDAEADTTPFGPVTVPAGMLFVLGDNRAHSGDSRFPPPTGVGLVPVDDVIGKAFVIVYPPTRWGWL